ncbi:hypothetical protein BGW39_002212, partial [Mortierella sp. 14UC]
ELWRARRSWTRCRPRHPARSFRRWEAVCFRIWTMSRCWFRILPVRVLPPRSPSMSTLATTT